MNYKRLLINFISVLMALLIPLIIFIYNFNSAVFDRDIYKKEFSKYNVYENLENYDVEGINNDVLTYLAYGKNSDLIKNEFFNEREKIHLLDVKNIIQGISKIFYLSAILFFLFFILLAFLMSFELRKIAKRLVIISLLGSSLAIFDAVLLVILSKLNFDFIFGLMHSTFFNSGTFMFNPEFERIVVLYPQNLFFDFLIKIISSTIMSSIIFLFLSITIFFIFLGQIFQIFFKKLSTEKPRNRKL